jgi:hypothetical protein
LMQRHQDTSVNNIYWIKIFIRFKSVNTPAIVGVTYSWFDILNNECLTTVINISVIGIGENAVVRCGIKEHLLVYMANCRLSYMPQFAGMGRITTPKLQTVLMTNGHVF